MKGKEFKRGDVKFGKDLIESEVSEHPVWLELFHGNKELLEQVAQKIFKAGKDTHGYDTMMGIYLADELAKPHMKAAIPYRLGDASGLYCWDSLGDDLGRFVGVAPEALSAPGNLVKPYTQADVQAARKQLDEITGFMKPESVDKVQSLLAKL